MKPGKEMVSVIIPVHNGQLFLKETLESVVRQEYRPIEIIVVDDGSTDETRKVVKNFGHEIRYIFQEKSGPSAARNRGIKLAKGDVIAFLDADDLWPDDKLKVQMSYLDANPCAQAVFGRAQLMFSRRLENGMTEFEKTGPQFIVFGIGNALFRRSVFDMIGLFDEKLKLSEDVDLFMRMRERGAEILVTGETSLFYRFHHANSTRDKAANQAAFIKAVKMSIDRRKSGQGRIAKLWIEK